MEEWKAWIGGQRVEAESGRTYAVVNPATGEEIARIPLCGKADADKAVQAARRAFPVWSRKPQAERSAIVSRFAYGLTKHARELAEFDSLDHGTPIRKALLEISVSAERLLRVARAGRVMMGSRIPVRAGFPFFLRHDPIGVYALVPPWNAPFRTILGKIGSALAVGNTCVVKPSSIDSLVALKLEDILERLHLPPGAVNILTGPDYGLGGAVAFHPGVDTTSFTAIPESRKSTMASPSDFASVLASALGERNRFIVFEDADLDKVLANGVFASFNDSGMAHGLPGRFYVHEKIYDEFVDRFVAAARRIVVGDPADGRTEMGPLASAAHRDRVEAFIRSGVAQGAALLVGGDRPTTPPLDRGYFVLPAVFANVTPDMRMTREEVYGPVACVLKISSAERMVELAGDFALDLGASVWTASLDRALRIGRQMTGGFVWMNGHLILSDQARGEPGGARLGETNPFVPLEEYTKLTLISPDLTAKMTGETKLSNN